MDRVDFAAHTERPPVGSGGTISDDTLICGLTDDPWRDAHAELQLRRVFNRHGCPGRCTRPGHRTDAAALGWALLALGLRHPPRQPPDAQGPA